MTPKPLKADYIPYATRLNAINEEHTRMESELETELACLRRKISEHDGEHGAGGIEAFQK